MGTKRSSIKEKLQALEEAKLIKANKVIVKNIPGPQGPKGVKGDKGDKGDEGLSAYELWLAQGYEGTEEDFLEYLKGEAVHLYLTNINLYGGYLSNMFNKSYIYYSVPNSASAVPAVSNSTVLNTVYEGVSIGSAYGVNYPPTNNVMVSSPTYLVAAHRGEQTNLKMIKGYIMINSNPSLYYGLPYFRNLEQNVNSGYNIRCYKIVEDLVNNIKIYDSTFKVNLVINTNNLPIISWENSGYRVFEIYNSISLKVVDESGTAVEGATVVLKDNTNTVLIDTSTNASGDITTTDVLRATMNWNGVGSGSGDAYTTVVNKNPMTLTISKAGYETYTTILETFRIRK